jgi:transcriptional regulator with XRE-family HTH domain
LNATEAANQIDAHIGARIQMRRAALGLTREAMAQALDLTVRQVEAFETGAARVTAGALFEIADLFDVKVAYFFESENSGAGQISAPDGIRELNPAGRA